MTLQPSPITNAWGQARTTKVQAEHFEIFRGRPGAAYNHHHQVTSLNGRLLATWSDGPTHEDEPGQHMVMATSDDQGRTWSPPRVIVAPQAGEHGPAIVTSMGIHIHKGKMAAYYGYYDYTRAGLERYQKDGCNGKADKRLDFHQGTHAGVMVSEDGGASWRGPVTKIDRFTPNLGPHPLKSGRLVIPGQQWFPYTDDPFGVTGWTVTGVPRLPADYFDDPEGFLYGKEARGDPFAMCEGSCFQTDDGVVHMMLRVEDWMQAAPQGEKKITHLAVTESRDQGKIWSEPMLTSYTDCRCRFHFGRLPDGRYFGVSCPAPNSSRTPLILAASRDGVHFDRHYVLGDAPKSKPRMEGFHKSGRYGYPSYHILGDTMFVIYSIEKEDIGICRFPLSMLD